MCGRGYHNIAPAVTPLLTVACNMDREPPEPKRPRITTSPDISAVKYPLELHHCDPRNAALYEESLSNRDQFWNDLAKRRIRWMKDFDKVREVDMNTGSIKWFLGGQLNVSGMDCLKPCCYYYCII